MIQRMNIPDSLVDVAETCGIHAVIALIDHFGGREMRFPQNPGADHPIIKALGEKDGRAVCHHLAGMIVSIPTQSVQRRHAAVRIARDEGKTMGEIARQVGLTQRHVRRILNERTDSRQTSLFD